MNRLDQLKEYKAEIWDLYQKTLLGQKVFTQEEMANLLADLHINLSSLIEITEFIKNHNDKKI